MITKDIVTKYRQHCEDNGDKPVSDMYLVRLLHEIFPEIKKEKKKKLDFHRLSWKNPGCEIEPVSVKGVLNNSCFLVSQTLSEVRIIMMTSFVTDGNAVMKELEVDFNSLIWKLRVRGKLISLDKFGISNKFNKTSENLQEIIHMSSMLRLCRGLELELVNYVPVRMITEELSVSGGETTLRMRCRSCMQVLPMFSVSDACVHCRELLSEKNLKDNAVYYRKQGKFGNSHLFKSLDRIFAGDLPPKKPQEKHYSSLNKDQPDIGNYTAVNDDADTVVAATKAPAGPKRTRKDRSELRQVKKPRTCAETKVQYPCGYCEYQCTENVVACDECGIWHHAECIHVEDVGDLPDQWICETCLKMLC